MSNLNFKKKSYDCLLLKVLLFMICYYLGFIAFFIIKKFSILVFVPSLLRFFLKSHWIIGWSVLAEV